MDNRYGNTLKTAALLYPNINKEIYLLEVSNIDILYNRFINKDWYKKDPKKYSILFPREWIDGAVKRHREQVYNYKELGYKIMDIDSTNGYNLLNQKEKNNGQGSSIGR